MTRLRLSPNILLRNQAADCASLRFLYDLCFNEAFVLSRRVCWSQNMRRTQELLTALTYLKASMRLHSRFGPGRYSGVSQLWQALPSMMDKVGSEPMVENIKTFFGLLDNAWGVKHVLYRDRATHLKPGFLFALADALSDCPSFWNGSRLLIDRDSQKKIARFPVGDPGVKTMACAQSSAGLLGRLMLDHINSGKRAQRPGSDKLHKGGTHREV